MKRPKRPRKGERPVFTPAPFLPLTGREAVSRYLFLPEREEALAVADARMHEVLDKQRVDPDAGSVVQEAQKLHWRHWIGGTAEVALAHWMGREHRKTIGQFREKDVGIYEVRASPVPDAHLIVRRRDQPDDIIICAYVDSIHARFDAVDFVGWIRGHEGKQPKYWGLLPNTKGRPYQWFVPREDLHPMSTLPKR